MYIITIMFPNVEGAQFDFDHYRNTYLGLVNDAFKPFGLGWGSVLKGEETVGGGPASMLVTTILSFPTEQQARDAMASEGAARMQAEVANFTNVEPLVQFNSAVP